MRNRLGDARGRVLIVPLLLVALIVAVAAWSSSPNRVTADALPGEEIKASELTPRYRGEPTTWDWVRAEKKRGRPLYVWFHADDRGNYALIFDRESEIQDWQRCISGGAEPISCQPN